MADLGWAPLFAPDGDVAVDKSVTTFTLDHVSWNRLLCRRRLNTDPLSPVEN
jgi:hypothetical protein